MNGLGGLSFWDTFRGLLHLYMLFVRKEATVMLDRKRMLGFAVRALDWLNYTAALDKPLFLVATVAADECSLFHLRYHVPIPDYNTTKGHHLVDMLGA